MKAFRNVSRKSVVLIAVACLFVLAFFKLKHDFRNTCGELDPAPFAFNALPATPWSTELTTEARLTDPVYKAAIESNYSSGRADEFISKVRGPKVRIRYRVFNSRVAPEKGAIVISSGRTESMIIYKELIFDLNQHGYAVYIHDHRGQGLSDRMIDEREKGYVEEFNDYVADLDQFVTEVVDQDKHARRFLLAHSMGGGIAVRYVENEGREKFDKIALVTPMIGVRVPWYVPPAASLLQKIHKSGYIVSKGPYCTTLPFEDKQNDLTHSRLRYGAMMQAYEQESGARIGGGTHRWLHEAIEAGKLMIDDARNINRPVLLLQGSDDDVVENSAQEDLCKKIPNNKCSGFVIPKSFHAVFLEADTFRAPALTTILRFLDE